MSGHASVRRVLKAAGLLLTIAAALLVGVGAIWEQVERQRAIRDFPVAGRLVDIVGRLLASGLRGNFGPTVLFGRGFGILRCTRRYDYRRSMGVLYPLLSCRRS